MRRRRRRSRRNGADHRGARPRALRIGEPLPRPVQIRTRLVRVPARDDKGTAFDAREFAEQAQCWAAENDGLASRLAIRKKQRAAFEIDVPPLEIENLARAHARQDQEADRRHGKGIENAAPVFRLRPMLRLRLIVYPGNALGLGAPQRFAEGRPISSRER